MPTIAVLNGPNLDRLGRREPSLYGTTTWQELGDLIRGWAAACGLAADVRQADGEGELVRLIHEASASAAGIVLNAGGLTHTSVAVRDAVLAAPVPVVEVHLTNPARREDFRRVSYLSDAVDGTVQGFGPAGYRLAVEGLAHLLSPSK